MRRDEAARILQVGLTASREEIQRQYHKLQMEYHPDRHPGASDPILSLLQEKCSALNRARQVLLNAASSEEPTVPKSSPTDTAGDESPEVENTPPPQNPRHSEPKTSHAETAPGKTSFASGDPGGPPRTAAKGWFRRIADTVYGAKSAFERRMRRVAARKDHAKFEALVTQAMHDGPPTAAAMQHLGEQGGLLGLNGEDANWVYARAVSVKLRPHFRSVNPANLDDMKARFAAIQRDALRYCPNWRQVAEFLAPDFDGALWKALSGRLGIDVNIAVVLDAIERVATEQTLPLPLLLKRHRKELAEFLSKALLNALEDAPIAIERVRWIQDSCGRLGVDYSGICTRLQTKILAAYASGLSRLRAKGQLDRQKLHLTAEAFALLNVPIPAGESILRDSFRHVLLAEISSGELEPVACPAILESDEECFWYDEWAELNRSGAIQTDAPSQGFEPGTLLLTSSRLVFQHPDGLVKMLSLRNVFGVEYRRSEQGAAVFVSGTAANLTGLLRTADCELFATILKTAVSIAKRNQAFRRGSEREPIPQHVRSEVWRRDGGKCRECGAQSNLQFDHVIPHSRGGADTVANLQLLCARCNLRKGARI